MSSWQSQSTARKPGRRRSAAVRKSVDKDEFRGALLGLIERKMKGERRSIGRRKPEPKVIDLMDALQASLAASKAGKSASAGRRTSAKPAESDRKPTRTRRRKAA